MFFNKKVFTPFAAVLLAAVICAFSVGTTLLAVQPRPVQLNNDELYALAVKDAIFADKDEILPLVKITKDSDMVTWSENGERVLMLTLHKYPGSYPAGQDVSLEWGEVWAFTDKEIVSWYKANNHGVTDWSLRLNQLLGMPASSGKTHVTAMWVTPQALLRPAYQTDITAMATNRFDGQLPQSDAYTEWFNNNIVYSYFNSAYPWTRLGYTYDWADNGTEYGLSEFIIQKGSQATVEFTLTLDEFILWLGQQR